MADAVLTQRLVVAVGALALLFLVVLALVGCFALLACAVDRYRRADTKCNELLAEPVAEPLLPSAPDNAEGIRLDWADECALIYSMPSYDAGLAAELDAGLERLRQAVRDQQNGEQA